MFDYYKIHPVIHSEPCLALVAILLISTSLSIFGNLFENPCRGSQDEVVQRFYNFYFCWPYCSVEKTNLNIFCLLSYREHFGDKICVIVHDNKFFKANLDEPTNLQHRVIPKAHPEHFGLELVL